MAAGVAEQVIETTADAVEFVAEETSAVAEATRLLSPRDLGFVGLGISAGAIGGYFFARRYLATKFAKFADDEIAAMREHYNNKIKNLTPKPDLEKLVKNYQPSHEESSPLVNSGENQKVPYHTMHEDSPRVTVNVFAENQVEDKWDYAVEVKSREENLPYIIHRDEFLSDENQHEKSTLTYFAGDDVLCDERDTPIDNRDAMIGDENLERFGHGSGDPNVLYIRNEPLDMEFEIVRSDGKFAKEVHGFADDELSHSERRRRPPRGFRDE